MFYGAKEVNLSYHSDVTRRETIYLSKKRGHQLKFIYKASMEHDNHKDDLYDSTRNSIIAQLILDRIEYDINNIGDLNKYKQFIPINAAVMDKALIDFYTIMKSENLVHFYGHYMETNLDRSDEANDANFYKYLFKDGIIKTINKKYADESKATIEALSTIRLGADLTKIFTFCYVNIGNENCTKYISNKLKNPKSSDEIIGDILMKINPFFGTVLASVFNNTDGDLSYLEMLLVLKHFYGVDFLKLILNSDYLVYNAHVDKLIKDSSKLNARDITAEQFELDDSNCLTRPRLAFKYPKSETSYRPRGFVDWIYPPS